MCIFSENSLWVSVSCKYDIYFGWSLEIQVIYIEKGCGALYGLKRLGMML